MRMIFLLKASDRLEAATALAICTYLSASVRRSFCFR